ncbi:MAG: hypothetical protein HND48_17255 [Chloroflexi bacterium]|nr:hypothetical protein [Chloroflexota bacterium]
MAIDPAARHIGDVGRNRAALGDWHNAGALRTLWLGAFRWSLRAAAQLIDRAVHAGRHAVAAGRRDSVRWAACLRRADGQ